jgi:hypothetical protein
MTTHCTWHWKRFSDGLFNGNVSYSTCNKLFSCKPLTLWNNTGRLLVRRPVEIVFSATPKSWNEPTSNAQLHNVFEYTNNSHRRYLHKGRFSWTSLKDQCCIRHFDRADHLKTTTTDVLNEWWRDTHCVSVGRTVDQTFICKPFNRTARSTSTYCRRSSS